MEQPDQSPEGELISQVMAREGLTIRGLARDLKMSDTRIGQIVRGYQTLKADTFFAVRGPTKTVARIAELLKIDPADFDGAGRSDVADLMRKWAKADASHVQAPVTTPPTTERSDDDTQRRLRILETRANEGPHVKEPKRRRVGDHGETGED
jgi:transcriptional regulator with XRE-family HTH domain